jgi:raffinose/stachyose/melibiose transport system permease protein
MLRQKTNWPVTILIALGSLFILFPLYIAVSIALKTPDEMAQSVLSLPTGLHFENFGKAIEATNFFAAFKNSALITVVTVAFTILTNSMVAYAIARNMDKNFLKDCTTILSVPCLSHFRLLCFRW